ncbi:molybdopterin molybdotransferase MoeA [Brevundimonas aurifodinae]|uniref:Molybdopterin molybdenumtransferase n=2 Tax=Brevundimonas TaxID=41275 RepID=A0ABV1NQZ9_9CAUL|nr:MAG: molybdopterin molybdenumtransferase MoeA [Brevundimonas subvibrioides]
MSLQTVEAARAALLEGVGPSGAEAVGLDEADGRWLAEPVVATRDQPPFDASAMDGWAVRTADLGEEPLRIVGESAAGAGFAGSLGPGETVRIFTGAPLPVGADRVVIQEEARAAGDDLTVLAPADAPAWVRRRGADYGAGQVLLEPGARLNPWRIALAASAGVGSVRCARRPRVAVLAGGAEVVAAGQAAGALQIFDAAGPGVSQVARRAGAVVTPLPLVGDRLEEIRAALETAEVDLIVVIGGASVGDHDRVKPAARELGARMRVEGIAMRPGKPLWAAILPDGRRILGLPGNPVSALVCGELFLKPLLAAMQGGVALPETETMPLAEALPANGPREHWMRAARVVGPDGRGAVRALPDQDSAMLTVLSGADGLIRRAANAPQVGAGEDVEILPLG